MRAIASDAVESREWAGYWVNLPKYQAQTAADVRTVDGTYGANPTGMDRFASLIRPLRGKTPLRPL